MVASTNGLPPKRCLKIEKQPTLQVALDVIEQQRSQLQFVPDHIRNDRVVVMAAIMTQASL